MFGARSSPEAYAKIRAHAAKVAFGGIKTDPRYTPERIYAKTYSILLDSANAKMKGTDVLFTNVLDSTQSSTRYPHLAINMPDKRNLSSVRIYPFEAPFETTVAVAGLDSSYIFGDILIDDSPPMTGGPAFVFEVEEKTAPWVMLKPVKNTYYFPRLTDITNTFGIRLYSPREPVSIPLARAECFVSTEVVDSDNLIYKFQTASDMNLLGYTSLQSDTVKIAVPELGLEAGGAASGGDFTINRFTDKYNFELDIDLTSTPGLPIVMNEDYLDDEHADYDTTKVTEYNTKKYEVVFLTQRLVIPMEVTIATTENTGIVLRT